VKTCVTCGDDLHPERAEKYDYCTGPECQKQNRTGLTMVSVGVNKSADQFLVLDERAREELAGGRHHDTRRASFGPRTPSPARAAGAGAGAGAEPAGSSPAPAELARKRARTPKPRRSWTGSQERLALLYNEQGLRPDEIADRLGLSRYVVTRIILTAPRRRR